MPVRIKVPSTAFIKAEAAETMTEIPAVSRHHRVVSFPGGKVAYQFRPAIGEIWDLSTIYRILGTSPVGRECLTSELVDA